MPIQFHEFFIIFQKLRKIDMFGLNEYIKNVCFANFWKTREITWLHYML